MPREKNEPPCPSKIMGFFQLEILTLISFYINKSQSRSCTVAISYNVILKVLCCKPLCKWKQYVFPRHPAECVTFQARWEWVMLKWRWNRVTQYTSTSRDLFSAYWLLLMRKKLRCALNITKSQTSTTSWWCLPTALLFFHCTSTLSSECWASATHVTWTDDMEAPNQLSSKSANLLLLAFCHIDEVPSRQCRTIMFYVARYYCHKVSWVKNIWKALKAERVTEWSFYAWLSQYWCWDSSQS